MRFYWGDDVYLQIAFGKETFEAGVLFFKIPDTGRFVCAHATKAGAPTIEGVLRDVVLAADLGDRAVALFGLLQELNNKTATICASVN